MFPQAHILSKGAVIWHPWLEYEIITQELTLGVSDAPWDDCFYNLWILDSVGEGKGGMIWENDIETRIISYMKRIASPGLLHDTGCLGLEH